MSYFVYPGNKNEFYTEYGGLPDRRLGIFNTFLIVIIIVIVIVIITAIAFYATKPTVTYLPHEGFYNLNTLKDLNNSSAQCCISPGNTLANSSYIYDPVTNITYSRQIPNIDTACKSFPNKAACIAANTDSKGNIIPAVVYYATPYYTFENGLFVGCPSTGPCPAQ